MKSPYFLLSITLIFLLTNCKRPQEYKSFVDFPVSVELSHHPIKIKNPIMYPSGFVFLDSALVVLDLSGDYFLNFFNRDDFTLRSQNVKRGRGPLEEESVFGLFKGTGKNELWYKTLSDIKILKYDWAEDKLLYKKVIPECDSFSGITYMLNGKVLGIPREAQNKEYVKISSEDCSVIEFGTGFPDIGRKLNFEEKNTLLGNKQITVKPDGELFAAFYHYFPILRIFNSSDGSLKSDVRFKNNQDFPFAKINANATQNQTLDIVTNYYVSYSTNRFIYSSYSGKSLLDLQPDILQEGFKIIDFANEIHVFDWDGKPVKRIILDKKIFTFAVSPDDKTLVAIPMSEPDNLLLYDLSAFTKD